MSPMLAEALQRRFEDVIVPRWGGGVPGFITGAPGRGSESASVVLPLKVNLFCRPWVVVEGEGLRTLI